MRRVPRPRCCCGGRPWHSFWRSACARYDLQFLDETVSFARLRLARDEEGRLKIVRVYTFEFSETGNNRRNGAIVMLGQDPKDIHLEPYRLQ